MAAGSSKVLKHPKKDEIIERLTRGDSVKDIETWLKRTYPRDARKQISFMTLQKFRSAHLNLDGEVLAEVKEERKKLEKERKDKQQTLAVKESVAYQAAKRQAAEKIIDIGNALEFVQEKIQAHIRLLEGETIDFKNTKVINDLLNTYRN